MTVINIYIISFDFIPELFAEIIIINISINTIIISHASGRDNCASAYCCECSSISG